jgi:PKD repeat protein
MRARVRVRFIVVTITVLLVAAAAALSAQADVPWPEVPRGVAGPERVSAIADQVKIVPDTKTVSNGDTFTVDVVVEGAQDLNGFDLALDYAPGVLEFQSVTPGAALPYPLGPQEPDADTVTFGGFKLGGGASGDHVLATVAFKAIGTGTSDLDLYNVQVYDVGGGAEAVANPGDGEVNVQADGACTGVTITGLNANTPVQLGDPMDFVANVTGTPPYTYTWDFGGAGIATDDDTATPSFTYNAAGDYTVNLNVDNPCGDDQDTIPVKVQTGPVETRVKVDPAAKTVADGAVFSVDILVENADELKSFTVQLDYQPAVVEVMTVALGADMTGFTPLPFNRVDADTVAFGGIHPSGGSVAGDRTLAVVTLEAVDPGTSPLTLADVELFDPDAEDPPKQHGQVTVQACDPVEITDLSASGAMEVGAPVQFNATVQGDTPYTYTWDFDGPGTASGQDTATPSYTYSAAGTYTVTLTVDNPCGVPDEDTVQVTITEPPCEPVNIVSISNDPLYGTSGKPVTLMADVDGDPPITYIWDFGDGSPTQQGTGLSTVQHTYASKGTYTVELTVENCGGQETDSDTLVVKVCDLDILSLTSDSPVGLGDPMHFTATVTGQQPYTFTWDFDGAGSGTDLDTATPTFTYSQVGTYLVTLTVENPCGWVQEVTVVRVLPRLVVKIDPPTKTVDLGDTFTVDVLVEGAESLAAYEFNMNFNPSVVEVRGVQDGPFLSSTGRSVPTQTTRISNTVGMLYFGAFSVGADDPPSDDGKLCTITLDAVGLGSSELDLHTVNLYSLIGFDVEVNQPTTTGDGMVNVEGVKIYVPIITKGFTP